MTALARFGALVPKLRPSIEVLLRRCLVDTDDEVRDRATFFLNVLLKGSPEALSRYVVAPLQVSAVPSCPTLTGRCPTWAWSARWSST